MSRPLVALHGLLGTPALFDPLAAKLRQHRVVGITLPGHGRPFTQPVDFDATADWLATQVQALGPVDLVGYSLGARIALSLLARHPQLVRRAVLISAHPGLASEAQRAARLIEDEAQAAQIETDGLAAFVHAWEKRPLFASQERLPAHLRDVQRQARLSHDPAGIAASLRVHGLARMPDYAPVIARESSRIALLVGEHDEKFRALAQTLPARAVETIAHAGHNPLFEESLVTAARIEALLGDEPSIPRPLPSPTPLHKWNSQEGES